MQNPCLDSVPLGAVDTGGDGQNALGAVVAGADAVAQGLLLPEIHKELGGHPGPEHLVQHLHGGVVRLPVGNGGGEAQAELALGHVHGLGDILAGAGVKIRLRGQGHRLPPAEVQQGGQQLRHLLRSPGAHIEQLYGALRQDALMVPVQPLGGDGRHLLRLPQPGQTEAVLPAHNLQQAAHGIRLLVVQVALDGGDEIFLFALHIALQEAPVFQGGLQQQLPEEFRHRLQHPIPGQGEALVHKAAIQPGGLVVPHPPHLGADGSAV